MAELTRWIAEEGLFLASGASVLLALGYVCVRSLRSPVHRGQAGTLALMGTLVWLALACAPLSRMLPDAVLSPVRPAVDMLTALRIDAVGSAETTAAASPTTERAQAREAFPAAPPQAVHRRGGATPIFARIARSLAASRLGARLPIAELFLTGAAALTLWLFVGQVWLTCVRLRAERPPDWLNAMFDALHRESSHKRWRLAVSGLCARPLSWGVLWPVVVIPRSLCRLEYRFQLRAILTHETAHLIRGDAACRLLFALACPVLFWNPLYWLLRNEVQLVAELLADDWAARQLGCVEYARALVSLAKAASLPGLPLPAVNALFSTRSQFYRRMHMLLERHEPLVARSSARWRLGALVVNGVIVGVAALVSAAAPSAAADTPLARSADASTEVSAELRRENAALVARIQELEARLRALEVRQGKTRDPLAGAAPTPLPASVTVLWTDSRGDTWTERWELRDGALKVISRVQTGKELRRDQASASDALDIPSPEQVLRSLREEAAGQVPFLAEATRRNVQIVVEKVADKVQDPKYYPLVGVARLHNRHFKCTVSYELATRSDWPVPFSHTDQKSQVVFVDRNHLQVTRQD